MQRLYIPVTSALSMYMGVLDEGTVMCRIFSKEEQQILRGFLATHKALRPLLREMRDVKMSEQYVLRFQGKTFIIYSVEGDVRMRGGQNHNGSILSYWGSLMGEYWYPELIEYLTKNQ